eukprot:Pompholyxophrys_sp_v1_NODE_188_length_1286_cov_1.308692.p3 type:complete len:111 gc:universal NODE_188_length_1286_cov_1.308692:374-706(+)
MDECKAVQNLQWSSRNNRLHGYCVTKDGMVGLCDVYKTIDSEKDIPASYILQTLWRDCTSDFDFVGPYFPSANRFDHKFLITCFLDTSKMGEVHGFQVGMLIVDDVQKTW